MTTLSKPPHKPFQAITDVCRSVHTQRPCPGEAVRSAPVGDASDTASRFA